MHFATLGKQVRKGLPYTTGLLLLLGAGSALPAFQRTRLQDFQRENEPRFAAASPERFTSLACRFGIGYISYGMTH